MLAYGTDKIVRQHFALIDITANAASVPFYSLFGRLDVFLVIFINKICTPSIFRWLKNIIKLSKIIILC